MINYAKVIYTLALYKFSTPEVLCEKLNLSYEELFSILDSYKISSLSLKDFQLFNHKRDKEMYNLKIFEYFLKHNKDESFTLEKFIGTFKGNAETFANYLHHIAVDNPLLSPVIFGNKNIKEEILAILESNVKKNISETGKLIKGNKENTEELLKLSDEKCIEFIALKFNLPPYIIAKELCFNKKGGFWESENIRTGYPFFLSDVEYDDYSTEELFYIIEHNNLSVKELSKRIKSSLKNIEYVLSLIKRALVNFSMEEIKQIVMFPSNVKFKSHELSELCSVKKENKDFLRDFKAENVFNVSEQRSLEEYVDKKLNNLVGNRNTLEQFIYRSITIKLESKETLSGFFISEDHNFIKLSYKNKEIEVDKNKVIHYRIHD